MFKNKKSDGVSSQVQSDSRLELRKRRRQSYKDSGPSLTKQSFRDECDINVLMARWKNTGVCPSEKALPTLCGDFTSFEDYHDAMNKVVAAQDAFMDLPSEVRSKFDNDPGKAIEFVSDPANLEELRNMKLLKQGESLESASAADSKGSEASKAEGPSQPASI